jgi:hypothetical protein
VIPVDDPRDPRLADYARLDDPEFRLRTERTLGFFVVEGPRPIRTLLSRRTGTGSGRCS